MIRVVLADDQSVVRAGLALLLEAEGDIQVVAQASTGRQAVEQAEQLRPDLVVMDVRMPEMDGVEATRLLTADRPAQFADNLVKVLVLTTFRDDEIVYAALRNGASGFLLKHAAPHDLVAAVRRVAAGDAWIDPTIAPTVIRILGAAPTPGGNAVAGLVERLTPREREILTLIAYGLSNAEIAGHLVLSPATVKTHVARILMKTGSRDRAQAVVLAYQSGLVVPSGSRPPAS